MGANGLLERVERARAEAMNVAEHITRQYDIDTLCIALARYEKVSFGYKRIMEIMDLWRDVREEYQYAIVKSVESDVARHHMDEELLEIARDPERIRAFELRYPEMKKITYEGKRRR